MVAIEHRPKSSSTPTTTTNTTVSVLSPTSSSLSSNSSATATTTSSAPHPHEDPEDFQPEQKPTEARGSKPTNNKVKPSGKMSDAADTSANKLQLQEAGAVAVAAGGGSGGGGGAKSAVSQRSVDIKIAKKSNVDATKQELTKKILKLDLSEKDLDENSLKSPKSPITARLPHQTSLTSSVDVEDRKTLREALYQGIFHRHRRTIFAVGSFLRMLRSRNSSYNTIRSSSEGEDIDEVR